MLQKRRVSLVLARSHWCTPKVSNLLTSYSILSGCFHFLITSKIHRLRGGLWSRIKHTATAYRTSPYVYYQSLLIRWYWNVYALFLIVNTQRDESVWVHSLQKASLKYRRIRATIRIVLRSIHYWRKKLYRPIWKWTTTMNLMLQIPSI